MSGSSQTFKRTGKNVTVSRDDLINATIERLASFDSLPADQKMKVANPYQDEIYVKTGDDKMVQVPRYIQNVAIVRWRSDKASSHTRMDRRKRYTGRDPYIMNRDLQKVEGDYDDLEDADHDLVDRDTASHEAGNVQRRRAVGQTSVPDDRYGRGGSYGDLPRDFEIFGRRVSRGVQDTTYVNQRNRPSRVNPDGFYDDYDENDFGTHADYEARIRSRSNGPANRRDMRRQRSVGGPAAQTGDSNIVGIEGETNAESAPSGEAVVENYAPLDDEPMEYDESVDNYDPYARECNECNMGDDRPIYRGQRRRSDDAEYEYDDQYEDEDYDNEQDDPENEGMIEGMDNDNCDNTYKYLFFVLLFVVLFLFYNYKKNNGTGLNF